MGVCTWLPEHDASILANYGELSAQQIAELVDRSRDAVIGRYHRLKRTPFPSNATRRNLKRDQAFERKAKRIAQRDAKNAQEIPSRSASVNASLERRRSEGRIPPCGALHQKYHERDGSGHRPQSDAPGCFNPLLTISAREDSQLFGQRIGRLGCSRL